MFIVVSLVFCVGIAINGCGAANIGRVIGGSNAPEHKYPYQVSFRRKRPGRPDFHFCSGSILDERWLLTAAHCFDGRNTENTVVAAGTNYLDERGDEYTIQFYVIHEQYKEFHHYDIALVRINGEIKFTDHVMPIPMAETDYIKDKVPAIFAGWGSTWLGGPGPNELQEIDLYVVTNEECREIHPINERHICTFTKHSEGICYGDSGGPLVVDGHQVGIASYVRPCAVGYPDVYTRVFQYTKWIEDIQDKYALVFSY